MTLPLLNEEQSGDSECPVASSTFGRRLAAAIGLLAAMCGPQGWAGEKRFTYKEPFSLQERGIGANPIEGQLTLDARDEEPVVSRVLLQTIQGFHLSIPERPPNAAEPLLPKRDYKTDMAPLSDEEVRKYNASETGKLVLDGTLEYALQYVVSYEIHVERDRYFFIEIKPKLYFKGAASSEWREYKREYSGDYFASVLMDALKGNFKMAARSTQPPH